jgi:hypothetical protein
MEATMNDFGKCCGGGRRASPRIEAPLTTVLTTLSETFTAILVDLSTTGVRLKSAALPAEGEDLIVAIEAVRAFGTVAWQHAGECGVAFDGPLPSEDVEAIRRKAVKGWRYAPEIRAAFEAWTLGTAR